jgi:hypothetical protein
MLQDGGEFFRRAKEYTVWAVPDKDWRFRIADFQFEPQAPKSAIGNPQSKC